MAIEHGRMIRGKDDQPLRTKIVATLGSPTSYRKGIVGIDERLTKSNAVTYPFLIKGFIENGVDVIRLNLTHVKKEDIAPVYAAVRAAILDCEGQGITEKRIAVLADLPGPKIRFDFDEKNPVVFKVGKPFVVTFARGKDDRGLVYVGSTPLKQAMTESDKRWPILPMDKDSNDLESRERRRIAESVLGGRVSHGPAPDTFKSMMRTISDRLTTPEGVLVRIGDGEVVLRVTAARDDQLHCTVFSVKDSPLSGKKGFTLKGVDLEVPSFTPEDQEKLDRLLQCEYARSAEDKGGAVLTFIALSFAQSANDVLRIKYHMKNKLTQLRGGAPQTPDYGAPAVIAKIESNKGWDNRDLILDVADGAMVARGDLGLQMEIENVPAIQKILIKLCNKRGKPVITATEMLKSMTDAVEPTRAEGSDVFNAIIDGSDAVMMSEETSKGRYPFHSIRKMIAIAVEAEIYAEFKRLEDPSRQQTAYRLQFQNFLIEADEIIQSAADRFREIAALLSGAGLKPEYREKHEQELSWYLDLYQKKNQKTAKQRTTDRITHATFTMSEAEDIAAILAPTTSGRTVRMIARLKPRVPIIGAAHDMLNTRKLIISYGVWPICIGRMKEGQGPEHMYDLCVQSISHDEHLNELLTNNMVIFTAGTPVEHPGTTNLIQIKVYEPPEAQSTELAAASSAEVSSQAPPAKTPPRTSVRPRGSARAPRRRA